MDERINVRGEYPAALGIGAGIGGCPLHIQPVIADAESGIVIECEFTHFCAGDPEHGRSLVEYGMVVLPKCGHFEHAHKEVTYCLN